MVKSKKLSRGSLAVLLLALLLALSMVVGLTGAWFTDKATDYKQDTITFGNIDISAGLTAIAANTWQNALPGDSHAVSGSVTVEADSEAMYVLVVPTAKFLDGSSNEVVLYIAGTGSDKALTATLAPNNVPETWVAVDAATGTNSLPEGALLYYVAKTNADKVLPLAGTVAFDGRTTNVAYTGESGNRTEVRLNVNDELSYTIKIEVMASAVQARNLVTPTGEGSDYGSSYSKITNLQLGSILEVIGGTFANIPAAEAPAQP